MRRNFFSSCFPSHHHHTTSSFIKTATPTILSSFALFSSSSSSLLKSSSSSFQRNNKINQNNFNTTSTATNITQRRFQSSTDDYYNLLGVSPSATNAEIKSAYKKQALKYHPDRNREPGAEDKFKKVSEAYSILSHDDKKRQYDAMRNYGRGGGGGMGGMGGMGGGGSGQPNYAARGPGSSHGQYGQGGGSYQAQYASRGGPGGGGQQQQKSGPFVFHDISKEEADKIFSSIFGMGQGQGQQSGGQRPRNPMDEIFGRPGMHPSQASQQRKQQQGPQIPPGSVLISKETVRNADGTFQRDETWRMPDGRTMKISHCYEKSGGPEPAGSSGAFKKQSGGFDSYTEQVGAQYQQQQQQKAQYDASGQKVNFPHNPFAQAGGNAGPQQQQGFPNPFANNPFSSASQSQSGGSSSQQGFGSGGGFGNPFSAFQQAGGGASTSANRGPGAQAFQGNYNAQNPFAGQSSFSQFNPFASFSGGRGGTGGAFAGGSSTQQNPFSQFMNQQSRNTPMGGVWGYSPGLRLVVISLLIGFVLASFFSFTLQHPIFFLFLMMMMWASRGRRFF